MKIARASFLVSADDPRGFPPEGPPEVAIAGRSNVGKSSAINRLVNRHGLAVTSSTPGRTRLVNFFEVDGRLRLVDLPGYGFAKASKAERASWRGRVERYLVERRTLRAVVHLVDARHDPGALDLELSDWLAAIGRPEIVVLTKADKLTRNQQRVRAAAIERTMELAAGEAILFSARTGLGRDAVWGRIREVARF